MRALTVGRCLVSYNYQAAPGVAPRETVEASRTVCGRLKQGARVPITFIRIGPWQFSSPGFELPGPLQLTALRVMLLIAFVVLSVFRNRARAASSRVPPPEIPPEKKASGPLLGSDA